jgi:hypothetical protein
MRGKLNLWLLAIGAVFLASWYFGRGEAPGFLNRADEPAIEETTEDPGWVEDPAEAPMVHLKVLNGTETPGLARDFSLLLGRAGCVAESVGNAPHTGFELTMLVNRRLDPARARALARKLGNVTLVEEWDDRAGEDAILVLGADHKRVSTRLDEAVDKERQEARK